MKITGLLTDETILAEIGQRIAGRRIDLHLTQAAVAEQAGIAKRTLERIEAGHSSQLSSLIRVLRVIDAAAGLDGLVPETGPRPMEQLKQSKKTRQRASKRPKTKSSGKPWSWGDDP